MRVTLKKMKVATLIVDKYGSFPKCAKAIGISNSTLHLRLAGDKCDLRSALSLANALSVKLQDIIYEVIEE